MKSDDLFLELSVMDIKNIFTSIPTEFILKNCDFGH